MRFLGVFDANLNAVKVQTMSAKAFGRTVILIYNYLSISSKLHVGWSNAVACQNANGTCCFFTASAGLEMTSVPKQIVLKEPTQCQCGCAKTANDCTDAQQFDSSDCSCKCKPPKKPVRCADNWTVMQFFVVKYYCSVCCIHNF